jgi:hypothetical protein
MPQNNETLTGSKAGDVIVGAALTGLGAFVTVATGGAALPFVSAAAAPTVAAVGGAVVGGVVTATTGRIEGRVEVPINLS